MPCQTATVVFAELPGLAELSGKLEDKALQSLLNALEELANATVRLHEGMISSFTGDSFTAVFVSQKASSSNGLSALEACQEFKERMESLLKEKKLAKETSFKAGIVTAETIITGIGDQERGKVTVIGPAVNLAGRLKDFAERGQVLVDGNIFKEINELFNFIHLEPLPVRGSKDQLEAWELKGRKRAKLKLDLTSERKITSEMVGRSKEMEVVEGQVKKLLSGKGAVVNIIGKAGIGKSRLMAELRAQDFMQKATVLEGRAQSAGRNLSFHPMIHILKSWAAIMEEDPMVVATEKLHRSIQKTAQEVSDEIFPFVATMMGFSLAGKAKERLAGIEGEALEKLILKNLRDLIARTASIRPLIIMIEDLHWSDSSTIQFLESLFKLVRSNQVMFINIFRPGYEYTGDYILKYLDENLPEDHLTIEIDRLEEMAARELIGNLLNQAALPGEITDMIIRKTEGNPFFIEEVIRSFIDEGVVGLKDDVFRVNEKIHQVNIPETINEVILSRVDKLDEKTKELLKTASVIGRNFYYKVLEEAADTIGELDDRLEYLKEVQFISESNKKEEIEYLFKHALAQQATYESIVLNTKKELHLKVARSIEKVFAANLSEFYGTLAYHYEKAEEWEKALVYLQNAGEESLRSGGSSDAISYFKKALKISLAQEGVKGDEIFVKNSYTKLGFAYHSRGLSKEAMEAFDHVLALSGYRVPKNKVLLKACFLKNFLHFMISVNYPEYFFKKPSDEERNLILKIIEFRAEALSMTNPRRFFLETIIFSRLLTRTDLSKNPDALGLFVGFSVFFFWTGISLKISGKIFKISERYMDMQSTPVYLKYRYLKKMHDYHAGVLDAPTDLDDMFRIGLAKGAHWETTTHMFFSGFCFGDSGNRQMCDVIASRLLQIADYFENSHPRAQYYRFLSYVFVKYREFNDSFQVLQEGIDYIQKTEHQALLAIIHSNLSALSILQGNHESAKEQLEQAKKIVERVKVAKPFYGPYLMAKAQFEFAMLKSGGNDNHEYKKAFRKTLKELIKTARKFRGMLPEAMLLKAQARSYSGNIKQSLKILKEAARLAEGTGARVDLARI